MREYNERTMNQPRYDKEPLALPLLAVMAQSGAAIDAILPGAQQRFGDILASSPDYDFDAFTDYYAAEFGAGLVKRIIIFANPREQRHLAEDKLWANAIEEELARENEISVGEVRKYRNIHVAAHTSASGSQARTGSEAPEGGRKRSVNLDPGYLTLSKLVLASTKDHAQRIYLGQAIWAEITLAFRGKSFTRHPWSYPDYVAHIPFLNTVRQDMRARLGSEEIHRLR